MEKRPSFLVLFWIALLLIGGVFIYRGVFLQAAPPLTQEVLYKQLGELILKLTDPNGPKGADRDLVLEQIKEISDRISALGAADLNAVYSAPQPYVRNQSSSCSSPEFINKFKGAFSFDSFKGKFINAIMTAVGNIDSNKVSDLKGDIERAITDSVGKSSVGLETAINEKINILFPADLSASLSVVDKDALKKAADDFKGCVKDGVNSGLKALYGDNYDDKFKKDLSDKLIKTLVDYTSSGSGLDEAVRQGMAKISQADEAVIEAKKTGNAGLISRAEADRERAKKEYEDAIIRPIYDRIVDNFDLVACQFEIDAKRLAFASISECALLAYKKIDKIAACFMRNYGGNPNLNPPKPSYLEIIGDKQQLLRENLGPEANFIMAWLRSVKTGIDYQSANASLKTIRGLVINIFDRSLSSLYTEMSNLENTLSNNLSCVKGELNSKPIDEAVDKFKERIDAILDGADSGLEPYLDFPVYDPNKSYEDNQLEPSRDGKSFIIKSKFLPRVGGSYEVQNIYIQSDFKLSADGKTVRIYLNYSRVTETTLDSGVTEFTSTPIDISIIGRLERIKDQLEALKKNGGDKVEIDKIIEQINKAEDMIRAIKANLKDYAGKLKGILGKYCEQIKKFDEQQKQISLLMQKCSKPCLPKVNKK